MKSKDLDKLLKLIAKTSFVVLVSLIFAKLFTYIYRIIIARYFGPEVYGLFSLAIMIAGLGGLFITISSLGLGEGLLRFIPLYRGKKENSKIYYIFRLAFFSSFISSIIFAAILYLSSDFISVYLFHNEGLSFYLRIFSLLIPATNLLGLFIASIRAYEEIKWCSFMQNILLNLVKLLFLVLLIFSGVNARTAVSFSYLAGIIILLITTYLFCKYKLSEIFIKDYINKKQRKKLTRKLFSYACPSMLYGVVGSFFYWIDSFLLGYYIGIKEVGYYNAAIPIASLFFIAQEIFTQLFFPLITKEYAKKNFKLIKDLTKQVGKWIFIINLPLFFIAILFPGTIINFIFGSDYLVASNSLRILSIGAIFASITNLAFILLLMLGKSRLTLINLLFFSLANFVLNSILIPPFGMAGAAVATTICTLILGIVFVVQANHYISVIPFKKDMIKIFFVSLIPLVLLFIIKQLLVINLLSLIIIGVIFIFIYLFLIYIIGCLDEKDLMILQAIKRKVIPKINSSL